MTTANNIVPLRAEFRDVATVPARIAERAAFLVATMGREAFFAVFDVSAHPMIEKALAGRVEASWHVWQSWVHAERLCRQIVNGGRPYSRVKTQREDGSWRVAGLVKREQADVDAVYTKVMPPKIKAKRPKSKAPTLPANVVSFPEHRRVRPARGRHGGGGRAA